MISGKSIRSHFISVVFIVEYIGISWGSIDPDIFQKGAEETKTVGVKILGKFIVYAHSV